MIAGVLPTLFQLVSTQAYYLVGDSKLQGFGIPKSSQHLQLPETGLYLWGSDFQP